MARTDSIRQQIVTLAIDKARHQTRPSISNKPGGGRAFRIQCDLEPFGFDFMGHSVEVYPEIIDVGGKDSGQVGMLLHIFGVLPNSLLKPIAAHDHAVSLY